MDTLDHPKLIKDNSGLEAGVMTGSNAVCLEDNVLGMIEKTTDKENIVHTKLILGCIKSADEKYLEWSNASLYKKDSNSVLEKRSSKTGQVGEFRENNERVCFAMKLSLPAGFQKHGYVDVFVPGSMNVSGTMIETKTRLRGQIILSKDGHIHYLGSIENPYYHKTKANIVFKKVSSI